MACVTCSKTMQCLGILGGTVVHWCPCCGTLLTGGIDPDKTCVERPKLVDRVREFAKVLDIDVDPKAVGRWHQLGVHEAIYPEGPRL